MTDWQATVLYTVVQYARSHANQVPSGKDLVVLLRKERRIGARQASKILAAINLTHACFGKKGRDLFLDPLALVTEPETAGYLLKLRGLCLADPDGRVDRAVLNEALSSEHRYSECDLENMFQHCSRTGYLEEIPTLHGHLRVGLRTERQFRYLSRLAGKSCRANSADLGEILR